MLALVRPARPILNSQIMVLGQHHRGNCRHSLGGQVVGLLGGHGAALADHLGRRGRQAAISDFDRRDPPDAPMGIVAIRAHG
jgi:hypothetical protein